MVWSSRSSGARIASPRVYPGVPVGAMCSNGALAMFRSALRFAASLGVAVLCLGAVLAEGGCNEKAVPGSGAADSGAHHTSESLTPEQAAKVLAKVGDKTITLGDYVAALEHMDQFDRMRYQSPERRKELLGEMINVEL